MLTISDHLSLLESILVGADVFIQPYGSKEIILSKIDSFAQAGYLLISSEGILKGESSILKEGCLIWDPDKDDFPEKECAVFFPAIVFSLEREDGSKEDQNSCNWKFRELELRNPIDDLVFRILSKTGNPVNTL